MAEVKVDLLVRAEPEVTSEEIRWRMEQAQRYADTDNLPLTNAAMAVNKALAILRQGDDGEDRD